METSAAPGPVPVTSLGEQRRQNLVLALCSAFIAFYVASNLIGAKLFTFTLFGIGPDDIGLGSSGTFAATAGIIAFPLTFILTDIINEYFGRRVVRVFTILALAVTLLLQPVIQGAIAAPTIVFDPMPAALFGAGASAEDAARKAEVAHAAFGFAFGQTGAIVIASLTAFLVGQFLDIWVFTRLRRVTGGRMLWLRAQGSTLVSQLIDTFVVIYLAFVVIPMIAGREGWPVFSDFDGFSAFTVSVTNYIYKFAIAIALTPVLYLVHLAIDAWLGKATVAAMVREAHPSDPV
ncbi:MAG TPA: queuosine precursor transporter [Planctomycetota bacterium]|nr:queuosine precursor transporter [Planctomycetota bacterium]